MNDKASLAEMKKKYNDEMMRIYSKSGKNPQQGQNSSSQNSQNGQQSRQTSPRQQNANGNSSMPSTANRSQNSQSSLNRRQNAPQQFNPPQNNQPQFNPPQNNQPQFNPPQNNQPQFNPPQNNQPQFNPPQNNQPQINPPQNNQPQFSPPQNNQQQFNPPQNNRMRNEAPAASPQLTDTMRRNNIVSENATDNFTPKFQPAEEIISGETNGASSGISNGTFAMTQEPDNTVTEIPYASENMPMRSSEAGDTSDIESRAAEGIYARAKENMEKYNQAQPSEKAEPVNDTMNTEMNAASEKSDDEWQGNYNFSPQEQNASLPDFVLPESNPLMLPDELMKYDNNGYFEAEVTTADGAVPISDAIVLVSAESEGKNYLLRMLITDSSGRTISIPLPAPNKENSEIPDPDGKPFADYKVSVYADGFYTVPSVTVPIFATIKSIQPITMIPVAEKDDGSAAQPNS